MMASISTAALSGSDAVPTADAGMLAALAEHGDQEIGSAVGDQMLLGEVGVEATKTVILTRRGSCSRSPSAALACARTLMAQSLAASCAGGDVDVAPQQAGGLQLAVLQRQLAGGEEQVAALQKGR